MRVKRLKEIDQHRCFNCGRFTSPHPDGCEHCHYEARSYRALKDETYKWASNRTPTGPTGRTKIGIEGVDK